MDLPRHKVVVAHSPDADDAFMFYGLATGKVRSPWFSSSIISATFKRSTKRREKAVMR